MPDGQAEQTQLIRRVMDSAHDGVLSLDVPLVAEAGIAKIGPCSLGDQPSGLCHNLVKIWSFLHLAPLYL